MLTILEKHITLLVCVSLDGWMGVGVGYLYVQSYPTNYSDIYIYTENQLFACRPMREVLIVLFVRLASSPP